MKLNKNICLEKKKRKKIVRKTTRCILFETQRKNKRVRVQQCKDNDQTQYLSVPFSSSFVDQDYLLFRIRL